MIIAIPLVHFLLETIGTDLWLTNNDARSVSTKTQAAMSPSLYSGSNPSQPKLFLSDLGSLRIEEALPLPVQLLIRLLVLDHVSSSFIHLLSPSREHVNDLVLSHHIYPSSKPLATAWELPLISLSSGVPPDFRLLP